MTRSWAGMARASPRRPARPGHASRGPPRACRAGRCGPIPGPPRPRPSARRSRHAPPACPPSCGSGARAGGRRGGWVWAGGDGFVDHIPVSDVRRFERELLDFMEANYPEIGQHIRNEGTLPDEVEEKLREAVTEFARRFRSSEGRPAVRDENVEPMDEDEEGQESVRTYRRDTPEEAREKRGPAGQGASGTP